jgi:Na+/H+-translocating membrane pyrophosphatase
MDSTVLLALGAGIIAVLWAIVLTVLVMRKAPGNARMI